MAAKRMKVEGPRRLKEASHRHTPLRTTSRQLMRPAKGRLKDKAMEESANLTAPEVIAEGIADDLEAAL